MKPLLEMCGVYEIVNHLDGSRYIGSTAKSFRRRFNHHLKDLRYSAHCNRHLLRAWLRDGIESFEFNVLLVCSPHNVLEYEQIYIDFLKPEYNLSPTAGSPLGVKHSDEVRARRKEYSNRPEVRAAMSAALSRPEVKAILSAKATERQNRPEVRAAISARSKIASSRPGWKTAVGSKESHNRPEVRATHSVKMKIVSNRPEVKAAFTLRIKEYANRPKVRAASSARGKSDAATSEGLAQRRAAGMAGRRKQLRGSLAKQLPLF